MPPVIYTIPSSSPLYNVTYVKVYGATPVAVTYGYTSGYMMGFVTAGVIVYGTGYYYPPVVIPGPVPIYYPIRIHMSARSPTTRRRARGYAAAPLYGPYGGAATDGSYYNPTTGAWAHGGAIYGPNGGVSGVVGPIIPAPEATRTEAPPGATAGLLRAVSTIAHRRFRLHQPELESLTRGRAPVP